MARKKTWISGAFRMTGRIIAHYKILEKLGEGGMGVVYKARDIHLDRFVAIKILSPEKVTDPAGKRRFVQEAKAASALNHPNIVTIYDISFEDGCDFIAMEYVRGKTLSQLIGKRGLPLGVALKYAVQMADALAAAHAIGIVHRDLKPANVMVADQGVIKVLDFGLAKLIEPEKLEGLTSTQTTESIPEPQTAEGRVFGTLAYMSPEQAEGKKVDARSDIFSFGSVLYEMLAGHRAFQGDSRMSILAAVLREEPKALSEVVHGTPRELEELIGRCLRKDRNRRLQHMDDLKLLLEDLPEQGGDTGKPGVNPRGHQNLRQHAFLWIALAALLASVTAGIWWRVRSSNSIQDTTLTRLTWDSGLTIDPVLSPDGRLLAYASDRSNEGNLDIWVQQLNGGEPIRLTTDQADDLAPSFSPDSSRIAFRSYRDGGGIYAISALGGQERLIAKNGHNPRFSPDGRWIVYWVGEPANFFSSGKVYIVPATGGKPVECRSEFADARYPVWTPDGKHILFQGLRSVKDKPDWWVVAEDPGGSLRDQPVKTGAFEVFRREGLSVHMGPGGIMDKQIFFSANAGNTRSIYQVPISTGTWKVSQSPRRLTFGTGLDAEPSPGPSGRLVFVSLSFSFNIWFLPRKESGQAAPEIHRVTEGTASFDATPSCSRDGKKIVFTAGRLEHRDVWLKDLQTGREAALTATPSDEMAPIISTDGSKVAYSISGLAAQPIYILDLTMPPGSSVPDKVCEDCGEPVGWSPDRSEILYVSGQPKSVGIFDLASGRKTWILQHARYDLDQAQFSPDGAWISVVAYTGPDQTRIFAAPFRDGAAIPEDQWISITAGQSWDDRPRWSPEGNSIYFYSKRDGFGCIWKQALDQQARPVGAPSAVHHFHSSRLSMMHMRLNRMGIAAASDKLIFNLIEQTGNVWMMQTAAKD